jgi:hypothetical protein
VIDPNRALCAAGLLLLAVAAIALLVWRLNGGRQKNEDE